MNLIVKINQKGSDYHFAIYSDKKKKYFRTETNTKTDKEMYQTDLAGWVDMDEATTFRTEESAKKSRDYITKLGL